MPVVVTLRDGEQVKFDASNYLVEDDLTLGIGSLNDYTVATFHPNAWQYVSTYAKPADTEYVDGTKNPATYNIQVGDTEKAFKEAQRRADRGKQQ